MMGAIRVLQGLVSGDHIAPPCHKPVVLYGIDRGKRVGERGKVQREKGPGVRQEPSVVRREGRGEGGRELGYNGGGYIGSTHVSTLPTGYLGSGGSLKVGQCSQNIGNQTLSFLEFPVNTR